MLFPSNLPITIMFSFLDLMPAAIEMKPLCHTKDKKESVAKTFVPVCLTHLVQKQPGVHIGGHRLNLCQNEGTAI